MFKLSQEIPGMQFSRTLKINRAFLGYASVTRKNTYHLSVNIEKCKIAKLGNRNLLIYFTNKIKANLHKKILAIVIMKSSLPKLKNHEGS